MSVDHLKTSPASNTASEFPGNNTRLTSTTGIVPEVEQQVFHPLSEASKHRLSKVLARKRGISVEDALAQINEEEARRKRESFIPDSGPFAGKVVIRKPPAKKLTAKQLRLKKKKREYTANQIAQRRKQAIEARENAIKALELRKAGISYQKIADAMSGTYSSAGAVKNAIDNYLRKQEWEAAKDVVLLDLQRLDEYMMRCTDKLRASGDLSQIDRLMRIMDMKYRILGVGEETVNELHQHFGITVQNNGVQVIQGTEQDFVKAMMQSLGVDPSSQEAVTYLEQVEVGKPVPDAPIRRALESTAYENDSYIVDAEIVDDEFLKDS